MKKNCLEAETKNTKNEVIDESKKLFDFIYQNATVSDFKSKEEKFIFIQALGYFEGELYTTKEKDFLDNCLEREKINGKTENEFGTQLMLWKLCCYLEIKNILRKKEKLETVIQNILYVINETIKKIDYDGLKFNLSYNGKKLEVRLSFNYLTKNKSEIELFVPVEKPYSDVLTIVPLNI